MFKCLFFLQTNVIMFCVGICWFLHYALEYSKTFSIGVFAFMARFFVSRDYIKNDIAVISGDDVKHISSVLRMANGDGLTVCDGEGHDYDGVVVDISKTEVKAKLLNKKKCLAEPDIKIVLFQSLAKQGKMEYIIQKCTELGVFGIVPVYSKRCVQKPADKLARWQKVAKEAAKQSGRGVIPIIGDVISFPKAVERAAKTQLAIMPYEKEENTSLRDVLEDNTVSEVSLIIGPEGGFEPEEAALARDNGIQTVTLGKRILRTETAAAAVIPIIMYSQRQI